MKIVQHRSSFLWFLALSTSNPQTRRASVVAFLWPHHRHLLSNHHFQLMKLTTGLGGSDISAGDNDATPVSDQAISSPLDNNKSTKTFSKAHTVTVCAVPPPSNEVLWENIAAMRRQMKDPGYYRWPPHVNLLYPFLKLHRDGQGEAENAANDSKMSLADIVQQLEWACQQVPAFKVRLQSFGTFGGKKRGVLWLHPQSRMDANGTTDGSNSDHDSTAPLLQLQSQLESVFPMCNEQSKKGTNTFFPHMTISHFSSNEDAIDAQNELESSFPDREHWEFWLDRIYLLERKGDEGQFLKVAEIALKSLDGSLAGATETMIYDRPVAFSKMPAAEEDWVYAARMEMKARRKKNQRGRRKSRAKSMEPT